MVIIFLGFWRVLGIVKARQRKEKSYYLMSIMGFTGVFGVALAFLNQFVLSFANQHVLRFAILIVVGLMSFVVSPRVMELYKQEFLMQKQETDVSAPLAIRDFLTWKAWIKLKAIYGFHKMIIIYSILNIGAVAAILLGFIVLGITSPVMAIWDSFIAAIVSITIFYHYIWKAFKWI